MPICRFCNYKFRHIVDLLLCFKMCFLFDYFLEACSRLSLSVLSMRLQTCIVSLKMVVMCALHRTTTPAHRTGIPIEYVSDLHLFTQPQ